MLVLELRNVSKLADVSDYHATVRINERILWRGTILEHPRERGAAVLLRRAVNYFEEAVEKGEVPNVGSTETEVSK